MLELTSYLWSPAPQENSVLVLALSGNVTKFIIRAKANSINNSEHAWSPLTVTSCLYQGFSVLLQFLLGLLSRESSLCRVPKTHLPSKGHGWPDFPTATIKPQKNQTRHSCLHRKCRKGSKDRTYTLLHSETCSLEAHLGDVLLLREI